MKAEGLMIPDPLPGFGAEEMRIELDKKSLFALASDTRLEILKSLQPMRRTVSQLSEELNIDKAAVHRHLKKMEEGGLVKRYEDHGFVYYGLSWKARDLMSPNENTKIVILISTVLILAIAASFFLAAGLAVTDNFSDLTPRPANSGDDGTAEYDLLERFTAPSPWTWALPLIALGTAAGVISVAIRRSLLRPRQKIVEETESSDVRRPVPED